MESKVTFDTNVFKRLIDLKDGPNKVYFEKILEKIKAHAVKGYFSDTFVTLEGVMKCIREETFGSRKISSVFSSKSPDVIDITIGATMNNVELDTKHLDSVTSLLQLGLRGLRGQAYLGDNFSVPSNIDLYEPTSIDTLIGYREKMGQVEIAIGNKNHQTKKYVGKCRARELGLRWLSRDNRSGEIWYQGLGLCKNDSESKQVIAAIGEWADGESIIRHIGYGNDYFCTLDDAKNVKATSISEKGVSIFDSDHKKWLACEFGVKFVNPKELIDILDK